MTRHFYKHKVTGVISSLNDSFAQVFGDRFERVSDAKAKAAEKKAAAEADASADTTPTDAPKEGDK